MICLGGIGSAKKTRDYLPLLSVSKNLVSSVREHESNPNLFQTLAEILSEREMICHLMENILDEATRPWGVKVERVEIKVILRLMSCEKQREDTGLDFRNCSVDETKIK